MLTSFKMRNSYILLFSVIAVFLVQTIEAVSVFDGSSGNNHGSSRDLRKDTRSGKGKGKGTSTSKSSKWSKSTDQPTLFPTMFPTFSPTCYGKSSKSKSSSWSSSCGKGKGKGGSKSSRNNARNLVHDGKNKVGKNKSLFQEDNNRGHIDAELGSNEKMRRRRIEASMDEAHP
ncbi:hypothetical protein ACHAWF_012316 [Thalassiosira exigua]